MQGLLDDIGKKIDLPKELYVAGDGVKIIFNERGTVQKVNTFYMEEIRMTKTEHF